MAASRYLLLVIIVNSAYSAYGQECSSNTDQVFTICQPDRISGTELFLKLQVKPEENVSFCKCAIEFTSESRIHFRPEISSNTWCYYNLLTFQNGSDGSKTKGRYDCEQETWDDTLFFRVKPTDLFQISLQKDGSISSPKIELKACIKVKSTTSMTIRCQDANQEIDEVLPTTTSPKPPTTTESPTTTTSTKTEPTTKTLSLSSIEAPTSQLPQITAKEESTTTGKVITTPSPPLIISTIDGIIIGAVLASILFIFIINCIICLCKRRKKKAEAEKRHRKMKNDEDINMPMGATRYPSNPILEDQTEIWHTNELNGYENPTCIKGNESSEIMSSVMHVPAETGTNGNILNHIHESDTIPRTDLKGDNSKNSPSVHPTRNNSGKYANVITFEEEIKEVIEIPDTNVDHPEIVDITDDNVDTSVLISESPTSQ